MALRDVLLFTPAPDTPTAVAAALESNGQLTSTNVFRDLGFSSEEAENLRIRSELMARLSRVIEGHGLTQREAAKLLGGKLVTRDEVPAVTDEEWEEAKNINISIPTQREIDAFWF